MHTIAKAALSSLIATTFALNANAASGSKMIATAKATEQLLHARVGVAVIDTQNNDVWSYNADQRFPMASTFKTLACAALLDSGKQNKVLAINKKELQPYSPVTKDLVGQSITASDLCAATLRTSDNTAANKVLDAVGGSKRVTEFLRKISDDTTRLDRREPEVNEGRPGDERDTTTPAAMAATLQKLTLGNALAQANRKVLTDWLIANEVGGPLVRAGVPKDWKVADRTGAGGFGTRGVTAVIWPPHRKPLIAVIYITQTSASMDERNTAIADIARAIAADASE